jgi:hypothetical protein
LKEELHPEEVGEIPSEEDTRHKEADDEQDIVNSDYALGLNVVGNHQLSEIQKRSASFPRQEDQSFKLNEWFLKSQTLDNSPKLFSFLRYKHIHIKRESQRDGPRIVHLQNESDSTTKEYHRVNIQ